MGTIILLLLLSPDCGLTFSANDLNNKVIKYNKYNQSNVKNVHTV